MALWDEVMTTLAIRPKFDSVKNLQVRNIPDMDMGSSTISDLLLRSQGIRTSVWRAASVRDAMSQPAIFRAVSLISNTTGSLAVETFRNGSKMTDDETPRLVKRPDPFRTPRAFYRDGAYHLATRGELWWWIAKRDIDGLPLSLIVMPPWEVTVSEKDRDRLRPTIKWLDREIPRDDVRLITFMQDERSPAGPFQRGVGPLQLCGAAISVAVESTEWAANYYAGGGRPPLILKSASELGEDEDGVAEATTLKEQWMDDDTNVPKVIDPGIEDVIFPPESGQSAQMNDARNNENGNAARMFGIPGSLLEYQQSGSSLTYQNLEGEFTKFVKACLAPGYLEPIEQEMSDLLTRSTVARFNVKGFLRADQKTRWETYQIAVAVLGQEEAATLAREQEGLTAGDVEFAPVPFAPPQAVPDRLPIQLAASQGDTIHDWRCSECGRKLAESAGPGTTVRCRCKAVNTVPIIQARAVEHDPLDLVAAMVARSDERMAAMFAAQRPPEPARQEVRIEDGAIQVHLAPQPVHLTVPERPVTVEAPVVNVEAPIVNIPAQEPPVVNIAPTQIAEGAVQVHVAAAEPSNVTVNVPEQQAPVVNVNLPEQKPVRREIERDGDNKIIALVG